MNNKETVCAVVVTYNRKELLIECLEALLKQNRPLDAIYLIDNASTDKTPELLLEKGYINELPPNSDDKPWEKEFKIKNLIDGNIVKVHYVRMNENAGGAGGFYEGVKRAYEKGYDWLWLMDDDAEPKMDALEKLLSFIDEKQLNPVMVASKKVGLSGKIQYIHRGYFNLQRLKPVALSADKYQERYTEIGFASFVGPLFSRKVIEKIGFPNKDFFIWFDDVEYSIRANKYGKMYMVSDSVIVHKDGSEDVEVKYLPIQQYWKNYYGIRNRIYILKEHFSVSNSKIIIFVCLKAIIKILFYEPQKIKRIKTTMQACRDGLHMKLGKTIDPKEW